MTRGTLRLGTTDAFFLDRLTGRFVTDVSTASRTSLMNLQHQEWDETLCEIFGVPPEVLPEIVSTTGDFGTMSTDHGKTPITASVVDQQAALYGFGCRNKGEAKITFGTGAFALMITGDEVLISQNLVSCPRSPGKNMVKNRSLLWMVASIRQVPLSIGRFSRVV